MVNYINILHAALKLLKVALKLLKAAFLPINLHLIFLANGIEQ